MSLNNIRPDAYRGLKGEFLARAEKLTGADRSIVLGALNGHAFDNSTFDAINDCTTAEGENILRDWQKETYHREEYRSGMI